MEAVGRLAGGIAHDFNNLLTGILGNASLLAGAVPQDMSANIDSIINAAERAAELTRQLLAYAGKGRFVVEPVDLSEMVRHLSPLIRTSIGRTIELKLELDSRLPPIESDRSQIQQVIMNLAINAGEAVGEKAGRIVVRTGSRMLDAAEAAAISVAPGEYVWLQVADNGCGIAERDRASIFEPFFTTKFTGRGLGLAAVHGIVRMCKGTIQVESTPGQGSVFTVLFPAIKRVSLPVPEAGAEEGTAGAGVVLVVDDEAIVRLTAEAALAKYGYAALLAADGQEGVDMFARHARIIDVVLLDVKMPIMDGHEALERMQRIQPDVKVLVSSGYNESAALEAFKHQGVAGFVQKPYRAGTLVKAIRGVMERNGAR
jgi:CheY-like chemotaxis protein